MMHLRNTAQSPVPLVPFMVRDWDEEAVAGPSMTQLSDVTLPISTQSSIDSMDTDVATVAEPETDALASLRAVGLGFRRDLQRCSTPPNLLHFPAEAIHPANAPARPRRPTTTAPRKRVRHNFLDHDLLSTEEAEVGPIRVPKRFVSSLFFV